MRKTTFPEIEEYKSKLASGKHKTPYGEIYSFSNNNWCHGSFNKQGELIGESWWNGHYYEIRL